MTIKRLFLRMMMPLTAVVLLSACGGGGGDTSQDDPAPADFRVRITNMTHDQPMSPVALILHGGLYQAWEVGFAASQELEVLAEGGDPADLAQAADADPDVLATATGAGIIPPGGSASLNLTVTTTGSIRLTAATMLVNTNDAFGGLNGRSLDRLAVGESAVFMIPAYDAGTEADSETADTVPGPAGGGEGFNAVRDDTGGVRIHPGVISAQDGLGGSALTSGHRWDNPVIKLEVTRTG